MFLYKKQYAENLTILGDFSESFCIEQTEPNHEDEMVAASDDETISRDDQEHENLQHSQDTVGVQEYQEVVEKLHSTKRMKVETSENSSKRRKIDLFTI